MKPPNLSVPIGLTGGSCYSVNIAVVYCFLITVFVQHCCARGDKKSFHGPSSIAEFVVDCWLCCCRRYTLRSIICH